MVRINNVNHLMAKISKVLYNTTYVPPKDNMIFSIYPFDGLWVHSIKAKFEEDEEQTFIQLIRSKLVTQEDFQVGHFYKCVETDGFKDWIGLVVTKAPNNKIYPVYHENCNSRSDFLQFIGVIVDNGLYFFDSFKFEEVK